MPPYSACGLGTEATDALVQAVRQAQQQGAPVYGAKITGGGSGGTVAILGAPSASDIIQHIAEQHHQSFGGGTIFHGSSGRRYAACCYHHPT